MSINTVDALLGHVNENNKRIDYAGWDNAEEIVGMLNRCFFFGSITESVNPAYSPVTVSNTSIIAEGNNEYCFAIENDGTLTASFEALEADDGIIIRTYGCDFEIPIAVQTITDSVDSRRSRVVLPVLPDLNEIEKWIHQADKIWNNSELRGWND